LTFALSLPSSVLGSIGRETGLGAIALLALGTPIWYTAWKSLQANLPQADEQESYLRLGFLYLLSMLGLVTTMITGGLLFYQLLRRLLGVGFVWDTVLKDISGPIAFGVPMAVIWIYYRGWLARQVAFDSDPSRRAGKWRLSIYLRSLLGLAAVITGLISLVSVLVSLLLQKAYLGSEGLREPLAGSFASIAAGLLIWIPAWREAQAQVSTGDQFGDEARRSLVRKVFLYLVIFAAVIGGMVSAGLLIYALVNSTLQGQVSDVLQVAVRHAADLLIFALLLYYHLTTLRGDGAARADTLAARQAKFHVLVLDGSGEIGAAVQAAFVHRQLNFSLEIAPTDNPEPKITPDLAIISSTQALAPSESLHQWLNQFTGVVIISTSQAAREIWTESPEQAVETARAIFEGKPQDVQRSSRKTSTWTYIAYVCAILFGIQLLFMLVMIGLSMIFRF
jgi:hypothetical protein